jgi:hypothetical protein
LLVAEIGKRLLGSKCATHEFDMERMSLKKLNGVESKEEYQVKISNMFAGLVNLHDDVDINRTWATI